MTRASSTYTTNTANALTAYRTSAGTISAQINAVMARTADTGQVNFATIGTAALRSANRDYELFAFSDALQATKPVFIKMTYGYDGIGFAFGTGSNGTGTLNAGGTIGIDLSQTFHGFASSGSTRVVYTSADGSYFMLALNIQQTGASFADALSAVVIERTRDADGTPNGDGLLFWRWSNASDVTATVSTTSYGGANHRIYDPAATQPGVQYDLGAPAMNLLGANSWSNGNTSYAVPAYGHLNTVPYGASKAVMLGMAADFARLQVYPISHYGTTMQFLSLSGSAPQPVAYAASLTTQQSRLMAALLRWE